MAIRDHADVLRLKLLLSLLTRSHPKGVLILLGEAKPLDACGWSELIELSRPGQAERVDGTRSTDGFFWRMAGGVDAEALIEHYGGWKAIVEAARSFRSERPIDWNLFVEAVRAKFSPLKSRLQGGEMERIASLYGVSRKTVIRRLEMVPEALAMRATCDFSKLLSRGGEVGTLSAEGEKR